MTLARKLVTATASGVLGCGVLLASASGALAADLPAPTVTPNPVTTSETFTLAGQGCLDGTGAGSIAVTIIYPDGHDEYAGPYPVHTDGTWSIAFSPNNDGPVPAGTYTINAVCDLYSSSLTYEPVRFRAQDQPPEPSGHVDDSGSPAASGGGSELADTGADAGALGWLAAGLLASGGASLYAGRRRDR